MAKKPKKAKGASGATGAAEPREIESLARVRQDDGRSYPLVISERPRTDYQKARQARVFDLKLQGYTYEQIAEKVGICHDTISADLKAESKERADAAKMDREHAVQVQIEAYELNIRILLDKLASGNLGFGETISKIVGEIRENRTRIDKLRGLEAATKIDVSAKVSVTEERKVLIAQITGTLGSAPILEVFRTDEDQGGGRGEALSSEAAPASLSDGQATSA